MRLLYLDDVGRPVMTDFTGKPVPPYAILSHMWGSDEVLFEDLTDGNYRSKPGGYAKIQFCAKRAAEDELQYFWVDTCCINRWNHRELSTAINSMFDWYKNATRCYVLLPDVVVHTASNAQLQSVWEASFRMSVWFTRGWTLQELVAPQCVEFYSVEGYMLGDKRSLRHIVYEITGIAIEALQGCVLEDFTIDERLEWANARNTTAPEDIAYCLLGILGISMRTSYGEGKESAWRRLLEELKHNDTAPPEESIDQATYLIDVGKKLDRFDRLDRLDDPEEAIQVGKSARFLTKNQQSNTGEYSQAETDSLAMQQDPSSRVGARSTQPTSLDTHTQQVKDILPRSSTALPITDMDLDRWSVATSSVRIDMDPDVKLQGKNRFAMRLFEGITEELDQAHTLDQLRIAIKASILVYSHTLQAQADTTSQIDATKFLRQQSGDIANILLRKFAFTGSCDSEREEKSETGMFADPQNVERWLEDNRDSTTGGTTGFLHAIQNDPGKASVLDYDDRGRLIDKAEPFLIENPVFRWLQQRVTVSLLHTFGPVLNEVSLQAYLGLKDGPVHNSRPDVELFVDWEPTEFVKQNFPEWNISAFSSFANIIVLTSDIRDVQASTVKGYLCSIWPLTGTYLLETIDAVLADGDNSGTPRHFTWESLDTLLTMSTQGKGLTVKIKAPLFVTVEVIEQISWLGSACRVAALDRQTGVHPRLMVRPTAKVTNSHVSFDVTFVEKELNEMSASCWRTLFANVCVADGFPIPVRAEEEKGLEIPFDMMTALGGADRLTRYAGQLVAKGYETLFVPVHRTASSVLWHLIANPKGRRMSYNGCISALWRKADASVNIDSIQKSRHFLGWVSNASQHAGTADGEYNGNSDMYLPHADRGCVLERGTITVSQMVGFGASITRGSQHRSIRTSNADLQYSEEVEKMTKMYVVLYDAEERRGWLIDAASAVLHLLRFHVARYPPIREAKTFNLDDFPYAETTVGSEAAKKILMDSTYRELVLLRDEEIDKEEVTEIEPNGKVTTKTVWKKRILERTFRSKVRQLWDVIEQMYDTWKRFKEEPGVANFHGPFRGLEGWKFQEVVEGESDMSAFKSPLDHDGTEWIRLIRHINAVVLIGNGFGELIRASGPSCTDWQVVPRGRCCLTIPVVSLKRICSKYGDPTRMPIKLVPDVFWPVRHPFVCTCDRSHSSRRRRCDRIQTLQNPTGATVVRGTTDVFHGFNDGKYDKGAVIFGGRTLRKAHDLDQEEAGSTMTIRRHALDFFRKVKKS